MSDVDASRVLIDGRLMPGETGIGRYTRTLVGGLPQFDVSRRYQVLGWRSQSSRLAEQPSGDTVASPIPGRVIARFTQFRVPLPRWGLGRPAVLHGTSFNALRFVGASSIMTCHDVAWLHVPDTYLPGVAESCNRDVERALRHVDVIAVDSRHSMNDLVAHYKVSLDRIRVLYPAVVDSFGRSLHLPQPATRHRTVSREQPYLLVVGDVAPRKNLRRVVEAFARMPRDGCAHRLVLAGPYSGNPGYARAIQQHAVALGVEDRVDVLGLVTDARLADLYDHCTALVCCSLYEGFGYPVAEAISRGVPVVTSDVSSLPEVAGPAAVLVDPKSIEAISEALTRVVGDASLRDSLSAAGPQQAAQFSDTALFTEAMRLYKDLGA